VSDRLEEHDVASDNPDVSCRRGPVAAESYEPSLLFTLYVALLLTVMAPVVWLLLVMCPGRRRAAALLRWSARTLVRAAGCPIEVRGLDHLRGLPSSVVVANHESFVDSVILLAALPLDLNIVINERLPGVPMVGTAIRRRHTSS
jgi:1-acyl-sn-glycerol-3-phosphate acyltransferase